MPNHYKVDDTVFADHPWDAPAAHRAADIVMGVHILSEHADRAFNVSLFSPTDMPGYVKVSCRDVEDDIEANDLCEALGALLSLNRFARPAGGPGKYMLRLDPDRVLSAHERLSWPERIADYWVETHPGMELPNAVVALISKQHGHRQALEAAVAKRNLHRIP